MSLRFKVRTHVGYFLQELKIERGETYYIMAKRLRISEQELSRIRKGIGGDVKSFAIKLKVEYLKTRDDLKAFEEALRKDQEGVPVDYEY